MTTTALLSVIVIYAVIAFWFVIVFRFTFLRMYRFSKKNKTKGKRVEGTVTSYQKLSKSSNNSQPQRIKIDIEFPNFAGTMITETFTFMDTKPKKDRYREGNSVRLELLENAKNPRPVKLAEGRVNISTWFVIVSLVLNGGLLYGAYWIYTKMMFKTGGEWEKLNDVFVGDESLYAALFMFGIGIFNLSIFKLVRRFTNGRARESSAAANLSRTSLPRGR